MQRPTGTKAPKELDLEWAARELVPFLEWAFGEQYGRSQRTKAYWVEKVLWAKDRIDSVTYYIDFASTIDTLRLYLVNKAHLTPKELLEFSVVAVKGESLCIRIFVHYAMRHCNYDLYSLGTHQSPYFPRSLTVPIPKHPHIKLPESEYEAIMAEIQKQLNKNSCTTTGREGSGREGSEHRVGGELVRNRFSNAGSDASSTQYSSALSSNSSQTQSKPIDRYLRAPGTLPKYNTSSVVLQESHIPSATSQESQVSSTAPQDWQNHPSSSQQGYLPPHGPYPGPRGVHGPSVPATTQTSMSQYHQQYPPSMQSQSLYPPLPTNWPYNSPRTDHMMSYYPSWTNPIIPEMSNPYVAWPPPAAIANQHMTHNFNPGQEQPTLAHTTAHTYVPHPETKEFIHEAARKSGLLQEHHSRTNVYNAAHMVSCMAPW
ncbi:hypothetical protein COCMIDRAFT_36875 [Bipolaris oryzae ATCC 44560]|uniref:Uncharacterized protein n=1 Tax=Bipolaris oryzae ATCC 44560 TaxID=930090 RepID=W6Z6G6_COCMI|nr:uncharacterized protein COCMIDRAFT_36875 [Bipolaris oryzae ATCC 44560]EUC45398.1 hypothetical protein COCMIDRAFT_36875 [Bipolaris oryzae ATCC 44560]